MAKMGAIKLESFTGCRLPQKAATAWTAVSGLIDVSYKPLIYIGEQIVDGVNYHFIAERTLLTNPRVRHVVKFAIWQKPDGTLEKQRDVEIF